MNNHKIHNKKHNHRIKKGIYFGFPKCCIKSFCIDNITFYTMNKNQIIACKMIKKTGYHGFIPCNVCSLKIINGEYKKLTEIIKRDFEIECDTDIIKKYTKEELINLYNEYQKDKERSLKNKRKRLNKKYK